MMKKVLLPVIAMGCLSMVAYGANKKTVKQKNPFLMEYKTPYSIPPFESSPMPTICLPSRPVLLSKTKRLPLS